MVRRRLALVIALVAVLSVGLGAQTFTGQLQQFWNQLRTGSLPLNSIAVGPAPSGGFLGLFTANNPTFGAATVVRIQNLDTSATASAGFDVLVGGASNVFFRVLVKGVNNSPPQVFLGANSTGFVADLALGATNLPVWLIKAGNTQGAPLGNLLTATNNQFDIGDSASTGRPRSIYYANKINGQGFTFANIGTVLTANGDMAYCSDCTIANPCAAAGNGALAKRLNGVNVCN